MSSVIKRESECHFPLLMGQNQCVCVCVFERGFVSVFLSVSLFIKSWAQRLANPLQSPGSPPPIDARCVCISPRCVSVCCSISTSLLFCLLMAVALLRGSGIQKELYQWVTGIQESSCIFFDFDTFTVLGAADQSKQSVPASSGAQMFRISFEISYRGNNVH